MELVDVVAHGLSLIAGAGGGLVSAAARKSLRIISLERKVHAAAADIERLSAAQEALSDIIPRLLRLEDSITHVEGRLQTVESTDSRELGAKPYEEREVATLRADIGELRRLVHEELRSATRQQETLQRTLGRLEGLLQGQPLPPHRHASSPFLDADEKDR